MVRLRANGHEVKVPVHIAPGLHDDVVSLALGYGRQGAGKVGDGVGVDAYPFVKASSDGVIASGAEASFSKVEGEIFPLANVQVYSSTMGRPIALDVTLKDYLKKNSAGIHKHPVFSIWPKHEYKGHKWAMTI